MGTTCRVATTMKVEKLIREMGGSGMMGITECKLLADGRTWSPVQTFRLDDDNVQKTVAEVGWTESRRVNGPPVWICPFHPGLEEKRRSGILAPTGISFIIKQEAIGILRAHARISTHHSAHTSISNCFPVLLSNNLEWPRIATKLILFHCIEVRLYSVDELRCLDAWDPKADSMSSSNSPARRFLVQLTTYVVVCIGILPAHLSAGLQGARGVWVLMQHKGVSWSTQLFSQHLYSVSVHKKSETHLSRDSDFFKSEPLSLWAPHRSFLLLEMLYSRFRWCLSWIVSYRVQKIQTDANMIASFQAPSKVYSTIHHRPYPCTIRKVVSFTSTRGSERFGDSGQTWVRVEYHSSLELLTLVRFVRRDLSHVIHALPWQNVNFPFINKHESQLPRFPSRWRNAV